MTHLTNKDIYDAALAAYIHITEWRRKLAIGFVSILVLSAAAYGWLKDHAPQQTWVAPLPAALLGTMIFLFERRNRWLIRQAEESAAGVEAAASKSGYFSRVAAPGDASPFGSHGKVLLATYSTSVLSLVAVAVCMWWQS